MNIILKKKYLPCLPLFLFVVLGLVVWLFGCLVVWLFGCLV
jgi:hypothetical protein